MSIIPGLSDHGLDISLGGSSKEDLKDIIMFLWRKLENCPAMTQIFLNEWAESRKKSAKRMKERSFGRKRSSRQSTIVKKPRTLNKDNSNSKSNARVNP